MTSDRPTPKRRTVPTQSGQISPRPVTAGLPPVSAVSLSSASKASSPKPRRPLWKAVLQIPTTWQFWVLATMGGLVGTGFLATALLLKLPAIPNCPSTFWPTASASLRLYCAQLAANKQTVDDLVEAIALVNGLPKDHPMREEVDRSIEQWASNILRLAEETFNKGDLRGAIAVANRIPSDTSASKLVEERVQSWQTIWARAEEIYRKAEEAVLNQDPRKAFEQAVLLVDVGNTYWETTKYQELSSLITASREDGNRLGRIRRLMRRGGIANLQQALKLLQEIEPTSPVYPAVRGMAKDLGKAMLGLAEAALDERDFYKALEILQQLPPAANLQEESKDFMALAQAQAQGWNGTVADLEAAIVQAQRIGSDRPLFGRAQELISRWQLEIQDVTRLGMAQQLAQPGTPGDLRAAIAEAAQIPSRNPRGKEARELINQWTAQVQTIEDRPILDQADMLAARGDIAALQGAVNALRRFRPDHALYSEARWRTQSWTEQIQRSQDQPILDRARQVAADGDLPSAIAIAQQIAPRRALYSDAQAEIRNWRVQGEGQLLLQNATETASAGTASALISAMRIASQVDARSPSYNEAERWIDTWSYQILQAAQTQAAVDVPGAIALLEAIPDGAAAYAEAQQQLAALRPQ
jgi:hypothetical protein